MESLDVPRNWIVVGNVWHLLVEVNSHVYHKNIIMYDTGPGFEAGLETNKKIKEADVAEQIQKELGIKINFV